MTHISLSSCALDATPPRFWVCWSLSCSRCLFLIPMHKDNSSMATPDPTSTNATDDALFFRTPVSPCPPELLLLLPAASAGTTLHTIITMPRATSPTPRAHSAYWDPEFSLFSLLLLLLLLLLPLASLPVGPSTLECISSVCELLSHQLQRHQKLQRERQVRSDKAKSNIQM